MSPFFLDPNLVRQLHEDRTRRLQQASHLRHARRPRRAERRER